MALPKQRHTRHRRDRARKMLELTPMRTQPCPKCGAPQTPHRACPKCGFYKGREVLKLTPSVKLQKKKEKKAAEK